MPVARAQFGDTAVARAGLSGVQKTSAVASAVAAHRARFDFSLVPAWPSIIAGEGELLMLSSGYPVKPGEKIYVGGFIDKDVDDQKTSVPPGVVKGIRFGAKLPPGAGTVTYTLFKNGDPTGCTFQVTGAQRKGKSLVEVQTADEDEICVEIDVSGDAEAEVVHNGSVHFVPDE